MRCIVVRGDAWPVLLSPYNTPNIPPFPCSEARRVPGAGHLPLLMTGPPQAGGRGGAVRPR